MFLHPHAREVTRTQIAHTEALELIQILRHNLHCEENAMATWKRLRVIRGFVGTASAGFAWWLFYLMGVWSGSVRSPVLFLCFFFSVVGIDRVLSTLVDLMSMGMSRRRDQRPHVS